MGYWRIICMPMNGMVYKFLLMQDPKYFVPCFLASAFQFPHNASRNRTASTLIHPFSPFVPSFCQYQLVTSKHDNTQFQRSPPCCYRFV